MAFGPVLLAVIFFLPPVFLTLIVAAIGAIASFELLRATRVAHHSGMYVYTAISAIAIPFGTRLGWGSWTIRACALLLMVLLFQIAIRLYNTAKEVGFEQVMVCMFGGLVIPTFLSSLIQLKLMEQGNFLVLLPLLTAFSTDIGAYFIGVFFGKHRGVTRVSPNKSLEGYIGGVAFGAVCLVIYGVILSQFAGLAVSLPVLAVYGLLGSAITELGDLSFSLVKRQHGVKDYGNLIPGHGGMLDRFDSMVFAAPALVLMIELFPAF